MRDFLFLQRRPFNILIIIGGFSEENIKNHQGNWTLKISEYIFL